MLRFILLVAGILMPSTLLAGEFDGTYRYNKSWNCKDVGSDGGALKISGNVIHGIENNCKLSNKTIVRGMNAALYDATCAGEGETYSERVMLMHAPNRGIYVIRDGSAAYWQRCP